MTIKKRDQRELLVVLDIGTSKLVALAAELLVDGAVEVIGMAEQPCIGLKKGMVVDIERTVMTIQKVLQDLQLMVDCKISDVFTGIAGSHIKSVNSHGMVAIKDKEVTEADIERVVETARAMPIPTEQQVLHILTQEFLIDGQDGVREPLGMSGVRLEAHVHIVTGAVSAAQNIIKCVRRCGLGVSDLILQPLASSLAVLTEDEKDLGVCLVDVGGGTADIAVFNQSAIRHTAVIPVAGDQVTNDIAMALRTPTQDAERIKCRYGCAVQSLIEEDEVFEVPSIGNRQSRKLSCRALAGVIQPRIEELYELIQIELRRSGYEEVLSSGIVLTGGCALIRGMVELGEEIFHMPVRVGVPRMQGPLADQLSTPRYSTAYGLLLEAAARRMRQGHLVQTHGSFLSVFERLKLWFQSSF